MTPDRSKAPEQSEIKSIDLIRPVEKKLDNGISFYEIKGGSQPALRLEFIADAGTKRQSHPLVASFTNSMLTEGTATRSAEEISARIDYYGGFLQTSVEPDTATITVHCLTRVFPEIHAVIADLLTNPVFPEKELKLHLQNGKQKYIVNTDKVDFLARKKFLEEIFGKNHPYGKQAEANDFDSITRDQLQHFFDDYYKKGNWHIIASGIFGNEIFDLVNSTVGQLPLVSQNLLNVKPPQFPKAGKFHVAKDSALQSGLRIGKVLFNKTHPDYQKMQVVNTLLGGYFGSRLMSNIREDKGYTYGIGSALVSMYDAGYFFITTEVGAEVSGKALKEIYFEIDQIREREVSEDELNVVKNYMLGSFLRNSEGPFAMADRFKSLLGYGLDYSYYDQFIEAINSVTPAEILSLSQKWLDPDSFTEVVAGGHKRAT